MSAGRGEYGLEFGQGEVRRIAVLEGHGVQRFALGRAGRVGRGEVASVSRFRVREVHHDPAVDELTPPIPFLHVHVYLALLNTDPDDSAGRLSWCFVSVYFTSQLVG